MHDIVIRFAGQLNLSHHPKVCRQNSTQKFATI